MKTLYTRTTGTLIPVCHRVRLDRENSITRIQFYQTKNRNSNEYAVHGVFSTQGIPIYGKDTLIRVQYVLSKVFSRQFRSRAWNTLKKAIRFYGRFIQITPQNREKTAMIMRLSKKDPP